MALVRAVELSLPVCPLCGAEKEGSFLRFDGDLICKSCRDGGASPTTMEAPHVPVPAPVVGRMRALASAVRNHRIPSWVARVRPASVQRIT